MPIRSGWEASPDRVDKYQRMMSDDPVGDVVITSKCRLDADNGFLIASDNGFAWRASTTYKGSLIRMAASSGKSKWVRLHDVDHFRLKKDGFLVTYVKVRDKKGALKIDGKGNPKLEKWNLILGRIKSEGKPHFAERRAEFYGIMTGLHNQFQGATNPPTSDSRI